MVDLLIDTGTGIKDFLASLVKPLQDKTSEMALFDVEAKKRAKFNGQKMVLQAALNDIFGVSSPDPLILVENTNAEGNIVALFNQAELSPTYFFNDAESDPFFIYNAAEITGSTYDFKVQIPSGIYTAELERRVRAETTLYKLIGTRFIIETY